MSRILVALLLVLLPVGLALAVFARARRVLPPSRRLSLLVFVSGAALAVVALVVERYVLSLTELSFDVAQSGAAGALLATFLLAAPLEEGIKVLPLWWLYRARRIGGRELGAAYGAACGAGFAAAEAIAAIAEGPFGFNAVRVLLSAPAHVFFAGAWGYALGAGRRTRGRWFSLTWLLAMLLHGLFDHILWGRGVGQSVAVAPLLLFMLLGSWLALRTPTALAAEGHSLFPAPPSIENVRAALTRPKDQPLMLRWIVFGAFVTLGLMVVLIAAAVMFGHRLGVDFALADQTDVRAAGPLVLIGAAVLLAFPVAGYLIARASATHSLLEPALAAALTMGLLVSLLSLAAPIGVLFALAVAPIALGLACGGAWVGIER